MRSQSFTHQVQPCHHSTLLSCPSLQLFNTGSFCMDLICTPVFLSRPSDSPNNHSCDSLPATGLVPNWHSTCIAQPRTQALSGESNCFYFIFECSKQRHQDRASLLLALPAILAVYIVTVCFHSLILRHFELIIILNNIYQVSSLHMGVFKMETISMMSALKTHLVATSLFHNIQLVLLVHFIYTTCTIVELACSGTILYTGRGLRRYVVLLS